ncbi:hypothetical protein FH039_02065 [Thermococcus indicus]|uniref:Hyaluronidase n=1 Tax=Thermococcus indicus TaxID=2586643 RepID=A0A4Y5SKD1_9EURY|nr:hypothetical protein [Thermococcus indicus]QDA30642.1 hypothetical protein FH039_02065 [Thermococcus indicus]
MITVTNFAMWWIEWNEKIREYLSRMMYDGKQLTINNIKQKGFDYAIVADSTQFTGNYLWGEGSGIPMSDHSYNSGYNDARELVSYLNELMNGMDYLVPVPYYKFKTPTGITNPRNHWRGLSYLYGWIDGASHEGNSYMKGFYWDLETPTQAYKGSYITTDEIRSIWGRILENKREYSKDLIFVWVPTLANRNSEQLRQYESYIYSVAKFFDYVFFQPHYYQCPYCSIEALQDIYRWVDHFSETYHPSYIEFEADRSVLEANKKENCGCGSGHCCILRACDYAIVGRHYPNILKHKAYYFSIDLKVIDTVRELCHEW